MSNLIAIVQDMYAAFGRGDVDTILAKCDPNVLWEFEGPAEIKAAGIRHGTVGARAFFEGIAAEQSEPSLRIDSWISSDDMVATFGRYECTLRANGKHVSTPIAHYFAFRNGRVVHYQNLLNTAAFVAARAASV
jgi:ketosteroid isomerase-like protein